MTSEELTRHLDSLVFQLKLSTNTEDQEILKSFKRILLDAYKLGYVKGQEDLKNIVINNIFEPQHKNKFYK